MNPFDPNRVDLQRQVDPHTLWSGHRVALEKRRLSMIHGPIRHPVEAWRDGRIIDGHHRTRMAIIRGEAIDVMVKRGKGQIDVPPRRLNVLPVV